MKNSEKMTNVKALAFVLANVEGLPDDVVAKLEAMQASLEKKSANRKPTAVQIANTGIMEAILDTMEVGKDYQCKDITKLCDISSTQRTSALMRKLKEEGKVDSKSEKGITYFFKIG